MHKLFRDDVDRSSFLAFFGTLWVCCALIIGGVLFAFFSWQAGAVGMAVATVIVLLLALVITTIPGRN